MTHFFQLKKKKSIHTERIVLQFHYTNWPDHGTPEHPLPILSFVRQSAAANPVGAGPIIVHCSAGVGRTGTNPSISGRVLAVVNLLCLFFVGTYIVLDAMLKQIECKNELNIRGFLCHIRNQRNFLVQTEEQYIFIHDALLEAIHAGNTNIHSSQLTKYLKLLQVQTIFPSFCDRHSISDFPTVSVIITPLSHLECACFLFHRAVCQHHCCLIE